GPGEEAAASADCGNRGCRWRNRPARCGHAQGRLITEPRGVLRAERLRTIESSWARLAGLSEARWPRIGQSSSVRPPPAVAEQREEQPAAGLLAPLSASPSSIRRSAAGAML